jgi:hypothetical protein
MALATLRADRLSLEVEEEMAESYAWAGSA